MGIQVGADLERSKDLFGYGGKVFVFEGFLERYEDCCGLDESVLLRHFFMASKLVPSKKQFGTWNFEQLVLVLQHGV